MGRGKRGKKKRPKPSGRGRAALPLGSVPSPGEPSPAPDSTATKQPPTAHGEARRPLVQLPEYFSKLSQDGSKAPAEPEIPKSDTGPPRPDAEPPKQALTSKDIHEKIVQLVQKELGPDAITLDGQANVKNLVGDIQQDVQKKCTNGPSRKKMSRILRRAGYYFKIVDIAIQHQPQVTALVWAGVRTIVQISLNHLDTLESVEQVIEIVPTTILMAEFYHSLYDAFVRKPSEVVRNTELLGSFRSILPGIYADIIVFMVKAKEYFEPASMTSAAGKSLVPFCIKFKPLMDGINEKEAALRKLMENVTMAQILENSEDLQALKHTLDEWRDNWERLVRVEDKLSRVIDDHEKERLIKCRKWLHPLQNPDAELDSNLSSKTEGTFTWIQNTEEFGLMIEGDEQNHLWIEGKPGAGKSVLGYLVRATRENSTRKNPVLYFFCKDGSSETSTAAAIVANLIDQLVTQTKLESLLNILSTGRGEHANTAHCNDFAILWGLFLRMVREFPTRIFIFVDALDECSEKERSAFMEALVSLPDNARLCVTSRGLLDIERAFQDQGYQRKILKLEMQSQEDIIIFLNESIDRNPELHCHREKVLEVAYHARGMFRYAALLVGELLHSPCQNISAALESPPADLNEMYETILLRLDTEPPRDKPQHRMQRKRILQWVAAARQPLKPSELAWSCAAVEDEESFDPESVDIRPQELMELCSPLLEIVDGFVHFAHLSVKEFLLQKPEDLYSRDSSRREQVAFYLVDNVGAHVSIATIGVALSRHVAGVKVKGCYPVINWPRHAQDVATSQQMSQDIQNLWDRVSRFLVDSSQFLAWALEFPWGKVLFYTLGYRPTRRGGHPRALDIASHYGLDKVLNQLLPADIGMVELGSGYSLKFGLLSDALLYAIYGGFVRIVQLLLDFGVKIETRCGVSNTTRTPLLIAASQGNETITQLLLDRGAEIEARDCDGRTPLSYAAWEGYIDVVRLLLDRGAEIETRGNTGETPLYNAAERTFIATVPFVRLLLDLRAENETRDNSGSTPASRIAWKEPTDVVRLLLDRGAEIEARDNRGITPLSRAASKGCIDVVRLLLDRGAEIETRDKNGVTPLSHAASRGSIDIVRLLLDRGAEIETRDDYECTPLWHAASEGSIDVVRLLLDRGAEIEARDDGGRTPLTNSVSDLQEGSIDVVRLLLDRGAEIETRDNNGIAPLSHSVSERSIDVVRLLLDRGAEIETRDDNGSTPLSHAVLEGSIDVVRLLLDHGVEIETRNNRGKTPLYLAAQKRRRDVIQLLLDRGADVETRADDGWTPLSFAALKGSLDIVRLFLDRGAGIETRGHGGWTPLTNAVMFLSEGSIDVVRLLLDRGAEIETRCDHGATPLLYAVLEGSIDVVRLLLDRGAEIEARDSHSQTPLFYCSRGGGRDVAQLLLDRGAEIEAREEHGWTPLSYAVLRGSSDVVRLLLDRGAEADSRDDGGRTPLPYAALKGSVDVVRLLLDGGAEIETRDDIGRTPLSYAVSQESIGVVQLLLDRGAEIETRDNRGRTPLSHAAEFAASHGYSAMLRFLLTWPTINIGSQDDEGRTAIDWAETISEQRTGRDKIASEEIVALLKAALL